MVYFMEKPIKMHDLGAPPLLLETPIYLTPCNILENYFSYKLLWMSNVGWVTWAVIIENPGWLDYRDQNYPAI